MSLSRLQRCSTTRPAPRPCGAAAPACGWLLRILLLLAFVVQGTIVQTHIDYARPIASHSIASAAPQLSKAGKFGSADGSTPCPWCQAAAMAGHYFLPTAGTLPLAPAFLAWVGTVCVTAFGLVTPPHGWLSRAPPQ